jgi:hypothetical protein
MNRILSALLFATAISAFALADCQPNKDHRSATKKSAGPVVEVVDVNLSGATTVDSAALTKIIDEMIGSCFDDKQRLEEELYTQFHTVGYLSVYIENLQTESLSPEVIPTPVQVKGIVIEGERCASDAEGSYQFLLDHRSNSLEADRECVVYAFSLMRSAVKSQNNNRFIKAMVDLLDFEKRGRDYDPLTDGSAYPATDVLNFPAALPYLVDAIKQSDSELVRTNAAETIFRIYRGCTSAAVSKMKHEAEKPGATSEQRTRLQIAAEYKGDYLPAGPRVCESSGGEPATEKEVQQELDRQPYR